MTPGEKVLISGEFIGIGTPVRLKDGPKVSIAYCGIDGTSKAIPVPKEAVSARPNGNFKLADTDYRNNRTPNAKTIRQLRQERNWSQDEFAARVGVTQNAVSQRERDICKPGYETLARVADAFRSSDVLHLGGKVVGG